MRNICLTSLKSKCQEFFFTLPDSGKNEQGIRVATAVAAGLSCLVATGLEATKSLKTKTTSLEGSAVHDGSSSSSFVGTEDDYHDSRIADVVISEYYSDYLTGPLGMASYLEEQLLDWRRKLKIHSPTNEKHHPKIMGPKAKFPTLEAHIITNEGDKRVFSINANEPIPIDNDLFVGQVLLVLRPLTPEDDPNYECRILDVDGPFTFHFQIQGQFKKSIKKENLYFGAQLTEEVKLGSLAKKASAFILRFLSKNMGNSRLMTYSFGTETKLPHISFPLHAGIQNLTVSPSSSILPSSSAADDCVTCSPTQPPPRIGTSFGGFETEEVRNNRRLKNDFKGWETNNIYSMSYGAMSVDLSKWKLLSPFETNLSRFWGKSALRLVIYEAANDDSDEEENNYLINLQLKHLPTSSSHADEFSTTP